MRFSLRNGLLAGGYAILAAVAVAGWVRHSAPAPTPVYQAPADLGSAASPTPDYQYTTNQSAANAVAAAAPAYADNGNAPSEGNGATAPSYTNGVGAPGYAGNANAPGYASDNCAPPPEQSAASDDPYLIPSNAPLVVRPAAQYAMASPQPVPPPEEETHVYYRRGHFRHRRSWKKSLAIVAGTAGAGAAIGAIAGGGRGAALGAVTGGGAGFLYDRLTHNR